MEEETKEPEVIQLQVNTIKAYGFPPKTNDVVVKMLFRQIPGFVGCKIENAVATVVFETPDNAKEAKEKFDGFTISKTYRLTVEYCFNS